MEWKIEENDHEYGDWRKSAVARLAQDLPATNSGAPAHKAGTPLCAVSSVKLKNNSIIGFTLPSASALSLDIASKNAIEAHELMLRFNWQNVMTPDGDGTAISEEDTPDFFDFLQKCMIVSTFSYQSLEVFCNNSIERKLTSSMLVKRRDKNILLSPSEIERQLSTSEKLCTVLPSLYNVPTPKGKKVWEPFKKLQDVRDASIHLKSNDQQGKESDTLYYEFLSGGFVNYPKTSADMISYFTKGSESRWLKHWYLKYT